MDTGKILHVRKKLVWNLLSPETFQHGEDGQPPSRRCLVKVGSFSPKLPIPVKGKLSAIRETRYDHDLLSETVTFSAPEEHKTSISRRRTPQTPPLARYNLLP